MADYSEKATQLPEPRPVSNVTPANSALVESAGQMVNLFTEAEKTGKLEREGEITRNNYFNFLSSASEEVANIAKAERLQSESFAGKPIAPADEAFLAAHKQDSDKRKAAYEQGYSRLNDFRLAEETRLRAAIRARPDLGDELRAISQRELGMDVYTSRMKMFSDELKQAQEAAESLAAQADKRKTQAMSEVKFNVDTIGGAVGQIYRDVDINAPAGAPNSIEAARANHALLLEAKPELQTEAALQVQKQNVYNAGKEFDKFVAENKLNDPAEMQGILADPARANGVVKSIDDKIASLSKISTEVSAIGTGSYKAEAESISKLAAQEIASLEELKKNFTPAGIQTYVESRANRQTVQVMNANPVIVNIAGDMIPKGAPDTERTKAIVTADVLLKRVPDNSWNSATEYTTTVSNSVPQVGNILLSDTVRSPALLPAKAPILAFQITAVAKGLSNPYKNADGTKIAPPMESIINRQGTGFLNHITQASDNAVNIYNELNPEQKKAYAGGIINVTNMYIQQKYQQAKENVPADAGKYIGVYKITDNSSLDRSDGSYLGWVPNTPEEVKAKYQPVLDKVQYSETGPNGLSIVRGAIKMMTNPSETSWFGGRTSK
jgi:hypothetical protein